MATRVKTDNEIKDERIKTISEVKYEGHKIQFERVFPILWVYAVLAADNLSYGNTVRLPWALCLSPTPLWPNSPKVSNCLSKFYTNYQNGKGFLQREYPLRSVEL